MIEYDGNQGEMIKLLKQRGKLIAAMKDDTDITNQIKVLKLDQDIRPKSAFITFNHTKALNLVNSLNRQKKNPCFECCKKKSKVMKLQEAEIVNNIKWEMRHQVWYQQWFRRILNFFIISIVYFFILFNIICQRA